MQAIILTAGQSNRFYPFNALGHKSMVSFMGKPLLQYTLESLKRARIDNVIIVVGEKSTIPEKIEKISGLSVTFVVQKDALGMGNALAETESLLEEKFFLLSGYHLEIEEFAKEMMAKQKDSKEIVLLAKEDTILDKYGILETDDDRVISLVEKPSVTLEKALRVISIYLLNKTFLQTLNSFPTEQYHFEKALDAYTKSHTVRFVNAKYPTITLKHSWDLLTVKDYLLSKVKRSISSKSFIAKSAIIEGNVVVSEDVKILEGACVKGPCYLGRGVIVGNNAILRQGVVAEENVVIGANMEVKNSLLMKHVTTHFGFIGDSVIGQYSRLAGGFCTANVRFDRKEITAQIRGIATNTHRTHIGALIGNAVDTGINVTIMPGISIGNNVTIGPSTMVMENIEENSLVYAKFQTVLKKKHE